ncbi:M15 family metallopeptidase [Polyangium sp. 15x6]|uniref:M15 family metallopeptidase n=1 Tax=Polyangium sp. 15x6 TaxID=3042687 RepID=UPI00249CC5E4|nr:M15 family metallopeptidase [Polyangium sp. 15x6]MDI3287367.1 M15 family metallopeptidase [Polyangium sp. 15x6]
MSARSPRPDDRRLKRVSRLLFAAALGLVCAAPFVTGELPIAEAKEAKGKAKPKAEKKAPAGKGVFEHGCRVQSPQKFLERRTFVSKGVLDGGKHTKAVQYLATHYGNVGDDLTRKLNPKGALAQAVTVQFMGLPVSVHTKVAPALACVEKKIKKSCTGASKYTPRALGGFRGANTYRGIEISNHLFGIALDIDPDRNPCCGCVDPWPSHPKCKQKSRSAYDRAAMPKCWIKAFERFGFDWLGHDALEDTMHFEFLGDPDRIKK